MNLNKEDVIILIQEYQKRRVLWDAKDKWHFNKNKKNDSWNEIAECLNISVDDAKKKISSLLGSFRREKAKGRKTLGTGKGAKDIYKSDWFAFNSFGFLMDKDDPRETVSSEDWKEDETVEAVELIEESGEDNIPISKSSESDNIQSPECAAKTTKRVVSRQEKVGTSAFRKPSTPKKRRKEKEDPRIEQAFQLLQQPIPEENSSTIYAKYLADQLEKFSPVTQAVLKHKINALIFDAEMEKYNAQRVENPYTAISYFLRKSGNDASNHQPPPHPETSVGANETACSLRKAFQKEIVYEVTQTPVATERCQGDRPTDILLCYVLILYC
ncbi:unnamed protein product [Phyllotreta striolata]|uniref:MADF domain-containing protein n=1 Tax=Phyllotreta striolata TaxID=444603 RepID=A0A9N9TH20_PHYSR|nr:unnamed protein product [Phyllotreta striolata]